MKSDLPSYRERLLTQVNPKFRPEADRFLRSYSTDPNEPILWFFAILVEEQALTRTEVEKQKWRIFALTGPDNWKRIVYSWAVVPVLLAVFVIGSIAWLNHLNMTTLRKLSEHPEEVAVYAKDTLRALEVANDNAVSINAIADLLNLPNVRAGLRNNNFVIVVPSNSIKFETLNDHESIITLSGDLRKLTEYLQRKEK